MFKATEEMGIRTVILLTPSLEEHELAELHEKYSYKEGLITTMFGLHAEYTLQDGWLEMINRLVHKYQVPFFTHCSETEKEKEECLNKRGITPFKFFFEKGLFDFGGGIYHGVSLTDEEIELIRKNNLFVVTNPGSNTKLASGICDTVKLQNNGVNLAIGTDGPASNNCLDMFKEMFLVTGLAKLFNMDPSAMDAKDVLKMATVNGAKAMGLDDADTLEVGKFADMILIDLNKPNMRPIHSIEKNLVYAGSKDNIILTMVNGKILYENGKFYVGEDENEIYKKCQLLAEKLANNDKN
jgi:5-methylthioadenosine/S-adenosylhomocysteine deaminase